MAFQTARPGLHVAKSKQHRQAGSSITIVEVVVLCLILAIGCLELAAYQRIENIGADSSIYMVLARNLLQTGRYEFNFRPHTVYPPGFPMLLAGISMLTGSATYENFIRFMPLITSAALIIWYFVLRRVWGQSIAGNVCLLAATAAPIFRSATEDILSDMPYFLVSGAALLALIWLGQNPNSRPWTRIAVGGLFVFFSLATVLTRSVGIALCAGILLWLFVNAPKHLKALAVSGALVGFLAFTAWTGWTKSQAMKNNASSYANQFTLKDPHHPEAGAASIGDLMVRAVSNVPIQSSHIATLLLHLNWVNPLWYSPFALITLVMLLSGIVSSLRNPWMSLLSAYFLAYFGIYLLWPFDEGPRFMLPIAPLAFALLWHGAVTAGRALQTAPSSTLKLTAALAAVVFFVSWAGGRPAGAQAKVFLVFWAFTAVAAPMLLRMRFNWGISPSLRVAGGVAIGALLLVGLSQQWAVARTNINPEPQSFRHAASVDCAKWLAKHDGIVMAQQSSILHRLLGRRVADFPITKDYQTIARAAARESTRYLVVNDPAPYEYFFPTEQERMQVMEKANPNAFQLVHAGPGYRIFEVSAIQLLTR